MRQSSLWGWQKQERRDCELTPSRLPVAFQFSEAEAPFHRTTWIQSGGIVLREQGQMFLSPENRPYPQLHIKFDSWMFSCKSLSPTNSFIYWDTASQPIEISSRMARELNCRGILMHCKRPLQRNISNFVRSGTLFILSSSKINSTIYFLCPPAYYSSANNRA